MLLSALFCASLLAVASSAPQKRATCIVKSSGGGNDDAPNVLAALEECGNGGILLFSARTTYTLSSSVEFATCVGCEIQIEGTIKLADDTGVWPKNAAALHINGVKGATIHSKTGSGVIDGNGPLFWKGEGLMIAYRADC
jgi:galacturan 1,4-alpha-galacturonidase